MSRAREEYESMVGGLMSQAWFHHGEHLVVDAVELDTPLTAVLEAEAGSTRVDPEWMPPEMEEMKAMCREELLGIVLELLEQRHEERKRMQKVFMDFLFADGPDPLRVLYRLFIYARACHAGHAWGMSLTQMAALFGHSKQNWQHMEERIIEDLVSRWSRTEFVNSGGKSAAARLAYSLLQRGNTHRRNGRKAGDELPPLPAKDDPEQPLSAQAKKRAREMRDAYERKRMAEMVGCDPSEIDLSKITPDDD